MINPICSVCGGKLNITIGSDIAVCESCNNRAEIPSGDVKKYSDIYKSAEALIRQNNTLSYENAIKILNAISFIPEAEAKIAFCETRLAEIKEAEAKRAEAKEQADKNDTKAGIIIIVMIVLVILLVVAGAIYIAVHLYRGDLSPKVVTAIITVIIIFTFITIIGKIKS
jgi:hypothetical protein